MCLYEYLWVCLCVKLWWHVLYKVLSELKHMSKSQSIYTPGSSCLCITKTVKQISPTQTQTHPWKPKFTASQQDDTHWTRTWLLFFFVMAHLRHTGVVSISEVEYSIYNICIAVLNHEGQFIFLQQELKFRFHMHYIISTFTLNDTV